MAKRKIPSTRNYSTEEKLEVIKRILRNRENGMKSEESCEHEGIDREVFYKWRALIINAGLLNDPTTRPKQLPITENNNITVYEEPKQIEQQTGRPRKYKPKNHSLVDSSSKCVIIVTSTASLRDVLAGLS